jgi:hypothetical protein
MLTTLVDHAWPGGACEVTEPLTCCEPQEFGAFRRGLDKSHALRQASKGDDLRDFAAMSYEPTSHGTRPQPFWVRLRAHYYLARRLKRLSPWRAFVTAFEAAQKRNYGRAVPRPSEVLVRIDVDGSVWELTDAEKKCVDTEFSPFDGARPYIKSDYQQGTALGAINGFIDRKKVPADTPVNPASEE